MTRRIMMIELRRSAAPWIGLLVFLAGQALLQDPERWTGRWNQLVYNYRGVLMYLWPFVVAAAAWLARREHASRVGDLLDSTSRPGWSRAAPRAVVLVACVAGAYLTILATYLTESVLTAAYQPPGWLWRVAVAALGITSAALLGLGLGRRLPHRLTPPALLALGIAVLAVPEIIWRDSQSPALLLSPGAPWGGDFDTVAARAASLLVCTTDQPKVCVTKVYEPVLPQLVDPARRALHKLSRLPNPPTAVVQDPHEYGFPIPQDPAGVHLYLTVDHDGKLVTGSASLERGILEGAGTWNCGGHDNASWDRLQAARAVAGAWLDDRTDQPADSPWSATLVSTAWTTLHSLPAHQQLARIAALRQAALNCQDNLYDILTAPARPGG